MSARQHDHPRRAVARVSLALRSTFPNWARNPSDFRHFAYGRISRASLTCGYEFRASARADELEHKYAELVRTMRERWDGDPSGFSDALLDEIESITHKLRYRHRLTERGGIDIDAADVDLAFVCGRCDTFPLRSGDSCPECGTARWFVAVRA
ncbi:hypothetical protein [Candidatus Poriferisodalis sp.]|uniref:hypothetical protein n=1 Tax=Candidatus Poriferisodalis sp. TaxID=3101277 RepID=UPI003B0107E1